MQYPVHLVCHKRSLLHFEDDTARLQTLHIVPQALRNVHTQVTFFVTQHSGLSHLALIVVDIYSHPSTEDDERLILRAMTVDGDFRSRLQCIEQTMTLIVQ